VIFYSGISLRILKTKKSFCWINGARRKGVRVKAFKINLKFEDVL
jgi:hypothetical protein